MNDEVGSKNVDKAYGYAIYLLSLKLRTEGELREKMRQKKYPTTIIDQVIAKLAENKYIDDYRYAEVYLANLKQYKNFGFYGIKKKLMEKRLPAEIIEQALSEGLSIEDETKIAQKFLKKTTVDDKNKTAQRLRSRGFRGEVIAKLVFR